MGILSGVPCAIKKVLISYLFYIKQCVYGASLVVQLVKNLPAMQETLVQFLGRKDPQRNPLQYSWASLVAQMAENLPAVQET